MATKELQKEEKKDLKKVDFTKIAIENIEGGKDTIDFSKQLGNAIYNQSKELGEIEIAREIYKEGIVELTDEQCKMILGYTSSYPYIVQEAFKSVLK